MLYLILRSNFILRLSVSLSATAWSLKSGSQSGFFVSGVGDDELSTGMTYPEAKLNPFARDHFGCLDTVAPIRGHARSGFWFSRGVINRLTLWSVEGEPVIHCDSIPA